MNLHAIVSTIMNNINAGLSNYEASSNIPLEQIEDSVIQTRLEIIKKYAMKNLIPKKDLYRSINCIETDCKSLDKCCYTTPYDKTQLHFEIPQIVNDFGEAAIGYIGSTDKHTPFKVYTDLGFLQHKYKMRGSHKPFVYIDTTPNENGFYDAYIFNCDMLERISVVAIWKDERQLERFACCPNQEDSVDTSNLTWLTSEIIETVTKRYLTYYRQYYQQPQPNDQVPK